MTVKQFNLIQIPAACTITEGSGKVIRGSGVTGRSKIINAGRNSEAVASQDFVILPKLFYQFNLLDILSKRCKS